MGTTNENALLANVWCAEAENHFAIRYVLNACVYIYNNTQRESAQSTHKANTRSLTPNEYANANVDGQRAKGETGEEEECVRAPVCICVINEAHIIFNSLVPVEIENRYGFFVCCTIHAWRTVWYSFLRQLTLNLDSLCAPYASLLLFSCCCAHVCCYYYY